MFETESKPHIQQFKFDIEGGSTDYTKETIRKWEWKFYKKCWVEGRWWPSWLSFKQSYLNIFQRLLTSSTKKYLPTYVSTYSSTFSTSSSMYLIINLSTFQQMDYDFKIRMTVFPPWQIGRICFRAWMPQCALIGSLSLLVSHPIAHQGTPRSVWTWECQIKRSAKTFRNSPHYRDTLK